MQTGQIAESEDGSYKGLSMPMDDVKNESKGFAFVEFVDKKVICTALQHTATRCNTLSMSMHDVKNEGKGFAFLEFVDTKVICNALQHTAIP